MATPGFLARRGAADLTADTSTRPDDQADDRTGGPAGSPIGDAGDAGSTGRGRAWGVIGLAVALYGLILATLATGAPTDAVGMLFALPVALLAVTFGLRGGLLGSLLGLVLLQLGMWFGHTHLSALGWVARAVPLLLIGVFLGDVLDRWRRTDRERRRLAESARRHREAVEINDAIVQGMSAAKWSLEAGDTDRAMTTLSDTLDLAHRLVSDMIRDAELTPAWTGRERSR